MARSSTQDPIEKFRFRVTVIALDLSVTGGLDTVAGLSGSGTFFKEKFAVVARAGFSQVSTPKAEVGEMSYRENIDNLRSIKVPGLVKFDPVTLSRGVTESRDLYDWYRLVNDELALLSVANELSRASSKTPIQNDNFRKDVIIEVLNRAGTPIKAWYLFNAWPTVYAPGNDLDASSNDKLIESLTLTYEFFLELEGGLEGLAKELARGAGQIAVGSVLDKLGI